MSGSSYRLSTDSLPGTRNKVHTWFFARTLDIPSFGESFSVAILASLNLCAGDNRNAGAIPDRTIGDISQVHYTVCEISTHYDAKRHLSMLLTCSELRKGQQALVSDDRWSRI